MRPAAFRPAATLRAVLGVFGVVCLWAAAWQFWQAALRADTRRLLAALVVCLPCWLGAAVLVLRVEVREDGLRIRTLLGRREVPWHAVRRIDARRASFTVVSERGAFGTAWLAGRDRLLRLILQHARLVARGGRLPWGLRAQYVPRPAARAGDAVTRKDT